MENYWWFTNLVGLISILGFVFLVSIIFKIQVALAFLPAITALTLLIFWLGVIDKLELATNFLYVLGLMIFGVVFSAKKIRWTLLEIKDFKFVTTTLFVFWGATSIWLTDFKFIGYDEFSHWALIVKYLVENNKYPDVNSYIMFMQYPPGTAVFQYYFLRSSAHSEQGIVFANLTMLIGCIIFLTSLAKSTLTKVTLILSCILIHYILRYDLSFIFVDALLGAYLAVILFGSVLILRENDIERTAIIVLLLLPIIGFMQYIKHVGLVLSLMSAITLASSVVYNNVNFKRQNGPASVINQVNVILAFSFIIIALNYSIWRFHYTSLGIADSYSSAITFENIFQFFIFPEDQSHLELWSNFFDRMIGSVGVGFYILLIWSGVLLWYSFEQHRSKLFVFFVFVIAGAVAYISLLLVSYAFFFGEWERSVMASFQRYARTYQLAWFWLLFAMSTIVGIFKFELSSNKKIILFFVVLILILLHPLARKSLMERTHIGTSDYILRVGIKELSQAISMNVKSDEMVYFLDMGGNNLSWLMLRYEQSGDSNIKPCMQPLVANRIQMDNNNNPICQIDIRIIAESFQYFVVRNPNSEFYDINRKNLTESEELQSMILYEIQTGQEFKVRKVLN